MVGDLLSALRMACYVGGPFLSVARSHPASKHTPCRGRLLLSRLVCTELTPNCGRLERPVTILPHICSRHPRRDLVLVLLRFTIGLLRVPMWLRVCGGSTTCSACGCFYRLVLQRPLLLCFRNSSCLVGFARCSTTRLGGSFGGITSLPLSWTAGACCGTWHGGFLESSHSSCCRMETKGSRFFLNPRLHRMTESAFSAGCVRLTCTMHALLPSKMLREFVAGSGKAWTLAKNSVPRIIA